MSIRILAILKVNISKLILFIGMNFVAATLYKILQDEYEAFLGLLHIMKGLNWRSMYLQNTPKLQNMLTIIQWSVDNSCPELS